MSIVVSGDKKRAARLLSRFHQLSQMNPNGFRKPSFKNGPPRQFTIIDHLNMIVFGTQSMPKRMRSERKEEKLKRRELYLERAKATVGLLPSGDTRLKR